MAYADLSPIHLLVVSTEPYVHNPDPGLWFAPRAGGRGTWEESYVRVVLEETVTDQHHAPRSSQEEEAAADLPLNHDRLLFLALPSDHRYLKLSREIRH